MKEGVVRKLSFNVELCTLEGISDEQLRRKVPRCRVLYHG